MIGHSDHYEKKYRSELRRGIIPKEKEPASVYATANPANATSWMVSHWISPVRQYVKNCPSCFVVDAGQSFIKVYMLWWLSYHGEYNNFHQIMWHHDGKTVVSSHALLAKTGNMPTTATACTLHHFPLGKNERFDETTFLFVSIIFSLLNKLFFPLTIFIFILSRTKGIKSEMSCCGVMVSRELSSTGHLMTKGLPGRNGAPRPRTMIRPKWLAVRLLMTIFLRKTPSLLQPWQKKSQLLLRLP